MIGMKKVEKQMSDSMGLAVVLTIVGGFLAAYSYNCRGGVFAYAQTGNIVLLGQHLSQGEWARALANLYSILAFVAGSYVSELMRQCCKDYEKLHWRQIVLVVEILILIAAGFMPQSLNTLVIILMSFASAVQVESFRKAKGFPYTTTLCVTNLRSATEAMCRYHVTKDPEMKSKSLHYYFIVLVFAAGVAAGAVLSSRGDRAIWAAAALLFAGFVMMFIKESGTNQ